mgnify:FL=1|tara:strand:+ start:33 stop:197 length:165 start_codon:yes stop_codon:yes gene_type:complete
MDIELENFLNEIGILDININADDAGVDPEFDERQTCMAKEYFRNPYDEKGELLF